MYRINKSSIRASEIAEYLNKALLGDDFIISDPRSIMTGETLMKKPIDPKEGSDPILIITDKDLSGRFAFIGFSYILSQNPFLDLAYVLREFFTTIPANQIHPTAIITPGAVIGRNVMVGSHTMIGPDVTIEDHTKIFHNVVIHGPVTIGKHCVIKDGAVIGSEGWGFIDDEDGVPFHPPQLGLIRIGSRVWIGSNSTIERGMNEETIIHDDAKIDDLVHIGAGSHIGQRSRLTAGVVVATDVMIGTNVHIAPHVVIRENLSIGNDVLIGMGSVVTTNLTAGNTYFGNPAKRM